MPVVIKASYKDKTILLPSNVKGLEEVKKLLNQQFKLPQKYQLIYQDVDLDQISVSTDQDLYIAIQNAQPNGTIKLMIKEENNLGDDFIILTTDNADEDDFDVILSEKDIEQQRIELEKKKSQKKAIPIQPVEYFIKPSIPEPPKIKNTQLKVRLINDPEKEIIVEPGQVFVWHLNIENNGDQPWPMNVALYCLHGAYMGFTEACPSLRKTQNYVIEISLQAPIKLEKQMIEWRLGYAYQGKVVHFGQKIAFELNVKNNVMNIKPPSVIIKEVPKKPVEEKKANEPIIAPELKKKIDQIKEVVGGDTVTLLDFITKKKLEKENIENIMDQYMQSQEK